MPDDFGNLMLYKSTTTAFNENQTNLPVTSTFNILEPASDSLEIAGVLISDHVKQDDCTVVTFINNSNYPIKLKHNIGDTPFFTSGGADYILAASSYIASIYVLGKLLIKTT